jgi:MFS family permease
LRGGFLQASAGLLRRVSARAVTTAQDAGIAAASLLAAFAPSFGIFAAARVLGNAVSWPQHPVGSAYLSDRFPHRWATVLSWHTAGGSIGTVTVPLFLSAVIAAAGWRDGLIVLGVVLLAGAVIVRVALPMEGRDVRG